MKRPVHDSIGIVVIIGALLLLIAAAGRADDCFPNHSGVCEGPPVEAPEWRPIDTTNGADIAL